MSQLEVSRAGMWPSVSSDASVIMHITSRYKSMSSVRGRQPPVSETDTCQAWKASQHEACGPAPSLYPSASLALSGYRCVIHRRSHSGALIGPTGLNKGWLTAPRASGHSVTDTHYLQPVVPGWWRCRSWILNNLSFSVTQLHIYQSDLVTWIIKYRCRQWYCHLHFMN